MFPNTLFIISSIVGDIIAISCILIILSLAILYIIKEKKKGKKCIGCPFSSQCSRKHKDKKTTCTCESNNDKVSNNN